MLRDVTLLPGVVDLCGSLSDRHGDERWTGSTTARPSGIIATTASLTTGAARRVGIAAERKQAYRRDDWDDRHAGEQRRPYGGRDSAWPAYESDDGRARYYEAVGEARGGRRAEDCVDAISGVKHVRNNLRYTSGVVSPKLD
jgi:hypothetical protein